MEHLLTCPSTKGLIKSIDFETVTISFWNGKGFYVATDEEVSGVCRVCQQSLQQLKASQ